MGKIALAYIMRVAEVMSWRLPFAIVFMVLLSLTHGAELVLLIPILQFAGVDVVSGGLGKFSSFVSSAFQTIGITPSLLSVLIVFVAIMSLHALLYRFRSSFNIALQAGFADRMRQRLYRAISNTNWLFFARRKSSDFTHVLTEEMDRIDSLTHQFLALVTELLVTFVYILVALQISPALTGIAFLGGSLLLFLLKDQTKKAHLIGEKIGQVTQSVYGAVIEHMASMKTTKSYRAEERNAEIFSNISDDLARTSVDTVRNISHVKCWFDIGSVAILAILLYVASQFLALSAASLLLLVYIFSKVMPRLSGLEQDYELMINLLPAFSRVLEMEKDCDSHAESRASAKTRLGFKHAIRFDQVTFYYDGKSKGPPLFRGLNLTILAGRATAIVGPSGSGKSSIADLVMGLITPQEGRILIDEVALSAEHIHSWRSQIGYVAQDTFLFHDSIRANLLWACPSASDRDLNEALRKAQCEEFVSRLPQGLETVVGDRGVLLSGGERQRLSLARAILRKPSLLILDEATSALDFENERRILEAIESLRGMVTIVIMTHRLSAIRKADQIHVLERGKFVESGNWNSLTRQENGRFRALWQAQELESSKNAMD